MMSATEALQALAKIAREKKIVSAANISDAMKAKMVAELDATAAKIEKAYTGESGTQAAAKTPGK